MTIIYLYEQLASKFGKEPAETISSFIDLKIRENMNEQLKSLATKHDLSALETKLVDRIGESKAEIIKWMFIFWATQLLGIFAFLQFFLKR